MFVYFWLDDVIEKYFPNPRTDFTSTTIAQQNIYTRQLVSSKGDVQEKATLYTTRMKQFTVFQPAPASQTNFHQSTSPYFFVSKYYRDKQKGF